MTVLISGGNFEKQVNEGGYSSRDVAAAMTSSLPLWNIRLTTYVTREISYMNSLAEF
jgi:hypothetical protein